MHVHRLSIPSAPIQYGRDNDELLLRNKVSYATLMLGRIVRLDGVEIELEGRGEGQGEEEEGKVEQSQQPFHGCGCGTCGSFTVASGDVLRVRDAARMMEGQLVTLWG